MWLLTCETQELRFFEAVTEQDRPSYAVLSHRWGEGEPTFKDVMKGRQKDTPGWHKVLKCCEQAKRDGYDYVWIDTCCIDKRSSAELSEAINSMYDWYKLSQVCYAYLGDCSWEGTPAQLSRGMVIQLAEAQHIDDQIYHCMYEDCGAIIFDKLGVRQHLRTNHHISEVTYCEECQFWFGGVHAWVSYREEHLVSDRQSKLTESVWFTRGWTLQELLAPPKVVFYNRHWQSIGTKSELCIAIEKKTRMPRGALITDFRKVASNYCIAERMSWAAGRYTTRIEDRAYSLLGLFDVNMPLLYGEGERAFQRLQEELVKVSLDCSIFAWTEQSLRSNGRFGTSNGMLAHSPDSFTKIDLQGFWPAARRFSWSKDGVEGEFALLYHRFEICAIVLGYFGKLHQDHQIPEKVFVVYLVRVAKHVYRRINVDGAVFNIFDQWTSRDIWSRQNLTTIRIEPSPSVSYTLSDSSDHNSEGVRSDLRHSYLELEALGLKLLPALLVNSERLYSKNPKQLPTEGPLKLDPYAASRTRECLILQNSEYWVDGTHHVLIFGFDLQRKPTIWFFGIDQVTFEHDVSLSDSDAVVLHSGEAQYKVLAFPESTLCSLDDWDRISVKMNASAECHADRIELNILGNQVRLTFLFNKKEDEYRVFVNAVSWEYVRHLPRRWVLQEQINGEL